VTGTLAGTGATSGVVLVTGGCGFIGANLVRTLVSDRHEVRVLDDLSVAGDDYLRGLDIDLRMGDVRDRTAVASALRGCRGVVHLAATTSVRSSVEDPVPSFETNARGTLTLLRESVAAGIPKFVFASTNAALGEHEPPLNEEKVPRPLSPYGASKLAAEGYCSAFQGAYGLQTVSLRFANAYGPFCAHKDSVVARFLSQIRRGEALTIHGDGRQTRDFVFVEDVVRAIRAVLSTDLEDPCFQIASGDETSVLELARVIAQVTGIDPVFEWLPQPAGEIRRNYAAIDYARERLHWAPQVGLLEGLELTQAWLNTYETAAIAACH
jgi:UDP-glucose 4-epimerase